MAIDMASVKWPLPNERHTQVIFHLVSTVIHLIHLRKAQWGYAKFPSFSFYTFIFRLFTVDMQTNDDELLFLKLFVCACVGNLK